MPAAKRRFTVHESAEAPHRARRVEAPSFEAAALTFVEAHHPAPDADDSASLIVEDCESGERQCFRIDFSTGETAPCD